MAALRIRALLPWTLAALGVLGLQFMLVWRSADIHPTYDASAAQTRFSIQLGELQKSMRVLQKVINEKCPNATPAPVPVPTLASTAVVPPQQSNRLIEIPICIAPLLDVHGARPVLAPYAAPARFDATCHARCNYPFGACLADSRRCLCCWKNAFSSFGTRNCSFDNSARSPLTGPGLGSNRFDDIYAKNPNNDAIAVPMAGGGSTLSFTEPLRKKLPEIFDQFAITSFADIPCGDFIFMRHVIPEMERRGMFYVGGDIAASLVGHLQLEWAHLPYLRFVPFDLNVHEFWPVDLIMVRDALFHLPKRNVLNILNKLSNSGARFLLTTTFRRCSKLDPAKRTRQKMCTDDNTYERYNENLTSWRSFFPVNLMIPPFNLPTPLLWIAEPNFDRYMGLWALPLPGFPKSG